ncbi:putative NOG1-nucleolar G-protein required for 60S ribosomal subunit biogenesis [Violaceomyces palustris]|uniref:NOG1-nucleolar G-protein required for 60S ribosomal subunit biogenesis n=1 Tax=Violaceomyces palustris TaxID=1673888 RepID=A0ACD0NQR2_9BASI|nr:putative NOG1-nucleolar G-protein required for 60S ribosomal subunit biogenesis [Violaceomyces palustris]
MSGIKASIAPVPTANDFLDIVLSKTQRKTPTVVHPGWKITRIRSFYSRKVMFTKDTFNEKLDAILSDFPIMDNLHPFISSLLNVLYDKNHYKLALGQLNTARHLIEQVAKDYVRLIKFGDSLYRCKQLKRAAMGRMATIMRRQKDPLAYLEQVRQHMSRLPSIDPSTRTLLICGYPNVGKSSFINKVTRADVDVQPYAFTTKSLFVGHMDYKYLRWQVIDTPGILDHPLEEMNTIEMQSITALAHLRSAVLYFMDLSEQCGYTIEAQVQLFNSIKPLFANKPTILAINKIDVMRLDQLDPERAALVRSIVEESEGKVKMVELSTYTEEGVMDVRNLACDTLLASRIETKMKGTKINSVLNRVHVAQPKARDDVERKPFVPEAIASGERKKFDLNDPERRRTEKDEQEENGGAGVFNIDLKRNYMLENDEWKYDVIPEIHEGKNIADFVDPDILEKLEALEREEEKLEAEGFYGDSDDEGSMLDEEEEAIRSAAAAIRSRQERAKALSQDKNKNKHLSQVPRKFQNRTLSQMAERMTAIGVDPSSVMARAELLAKAKGLSGKRKRGGDEDDEEQMDEVDSEEAWEDEAEESMDVDEDEDAGSSRRKARKSNEGSRAIVSSGVTTRLRSSTTALTNKSGGRISARAGPARVPARDRSSMGLRNSEQRDKSIRLHELSIRDRNREAKAGESDRKIKEKKPKWLFAGKRGKGTASHR